MSSTTAHYPTFREGRTHLTEVLDAAAEGRPASVRRDQIRFATLETERLVYFLARIAPAQAMVVSEGEGWSIFLPNLPIAADGATMDEALDEMVVALRDYAEAWSDRLRLAPNHEQNWGLVQLVEFASDDQLKAWLQGS